MERKPSKPPSYKQVFVISFSFANDSTHGFKSSAAFVETCRDIFDLPEENLIKAVIPPGRGAQYSWKQEVVEVAHRKARSSPGHHLLLFHYAGHAGNNNAMGEFGLCERCCGKHAEQFIPWSWAIKELLEPPGESSDLDVVCFLDLCNTSKTPGSELEDGPDVTTKNSAEVLAATERICFVKAPTKPRPSFTERLVAELLRQADNDAAPVTAAGLLTKLTKKMDPRRKPTYRILRGSSPIMLPIRRQRPRGLLKDVWNSAVTTPPATASHRDEPNRGIHSAVLEITVAWAERHHTETIKMLMEWLQELPSEYQVQVISVYDVGGTVIMLSIAYQYLSVVFNLMRNEELSVRFLRDHIFSANLLHTPIEPPSRESTQRGREAAREPGEPPRRPPAPRPPNTARATRIRDAEPPRRVEGNRYAEPFRQLNVMADEDLDEWNIV
ncbi:hypothetical protein TWF696_001558 [Orbilia brochopaga]|uniref:Uncharacterized protein n=1 Tax=Orbilia brochopaga TaxID=3140254 RepID=A0AAV9UDC3_9PEZI